MFRKLMLVGLLGSAAMAHASDKVVYAPVPDWVKPAPAIDTAKLGDSAPVVLLLDNQQRLADGQVWAYVDSATRASSNQVLGAIGTIKLPWQPSQGDLIIHRAEIIRGTEHIDLLKGGPTPFQILHREEQLEKRSMDGMLTATMTVPGLSVGDVLHLTYSTTRKDATLKGNMQAIAPLVFDPFRVQFARTRMIWPTGSDVRFKTYADDLTVQPVTANGFKEVTLVLPLAKQPEIPNDAPARFQKLPVIEATNFADWAAVAAAMTPLYRTDGLIAPGSPLAAEVDRIVAASPDATTRAALALQLVQDKVRYLFLGMDTGNYVPQTPAQTWTLRYGDCKAKTLLLLALLHAMKIEAEPVLANSRLGDMVPARLPSAMAFDHVLVKATIDGKPLWLDGTNAGGRLADIHDTPAFGNVLPLHPGSATLERIATHADARPGLAARLELDESAGMNLPAPFRMSVTFRGGNAEMLRLAAGQASKDELDTMAVNVVKPYVGEMELTGRTIRFDEAAGTGTIDATGLAYPGWDKQDGHYRSALDTSLGKLTFAPDRARPAWKDMPVAGGNPETIAVTTRIRLPADGAGFTLDGDQPIAQTIGDTHVTRTVKRDGAWITIETLLADDGIETPASAVPDAKRRFALMTDRPARALAPASYPPFWQDVEAAKRQHRLDAVMAALKQNIANKPDDAVRYTTRAWFLERVFDRQAAIADLDKAIAIQPDIDTYLRRARLHAALGEKAMAVADAKAAHDLDPSNAGALGSLASYQAEAGDRAGALALLQERIDAGGDARADMLAAKAQIEADGGDKTAAIATIDGAIQQSPNKPALLNSRCWIKGTMNVALDTALKDCTKSIELSDSPIAALDSRAMVYFRMNRMDDALADLNAVLDQDPDLAASMYMRGVIRKRTGDKAAATDLAAAQVMSPQIAATYRKYGIEP